MVAEDGAVYEGIFERQSCEGLIVTIVEPAEQEGRFNLFEAFSDSENLTPIKTNASQEDVEEVLSVREKVMGLETRYI